MPPRFKRKNVQKKDASGDHEANEALDLNKRCLRSLRCHQKKPKREPKLAREYAKVEGETAKVK